MADTDKDFKVVEITEIPSVNFNDDSLILAYTENEGIGTTAFTKAKEVIGSGIEITQTTDKKGSGEANEITIKTRNGKTSEIKTVKVYNGLGFSEAKKLDDTTDENGLVTHHYKIKASDSELIPDLDIDINDGIGSNITVTDGTEGDLKTHVVSVEQTDGNDKSFTVKDGVGVKSHNITTTLPTESNPKKQTLVIEYTDGTSDSIEIKDGISIHSHTTESETDENGLRTTTETIKFQDGQTDTLEIKDGVGIKEAKQTTTSTTSGENNVVTINLTDGTSFTINIMNGRAGKDFRITKTYTSIAAMQDDYDKYEKYDFVMIDTGSVEDVDTGKLFMHTGSDVKEEAWTLIGDLSGFKGETGVGIESVTYAPDSNLNTVVTFTMTDGSTPTVTVNRGAKGDRGASINTIVAPATIDNASGAANTYTVKNEDGTIVGTFTVYNGGNGVNATNIPMSATDDTKVSTAIGNKYTKPTTGIPKSDLATTVQDSLAKADSALQSYTEKYTGTYSKPATGIPKSDLADAVQKSLGLADSALQSISKNDVTTALGYTPPEKDTWRPLGTGANDACAGNDSRLSNAREANGGNSSTVGGVGISTAATIAANALVPIAACNLSSATSGYIKLANGFKIAWGRQSCYNGFQTVDLSSIGFSNTPFVTVSCDIISDHSNCYNHIPVMMSVTTSGFKYRTNASDSTTLHWIAIGN